MTNNKKEKTEQPETAKAEKMAQSNDAELSRLKNELEEHKKKAEEHMDRFLRLQAEFDNAKKRMQRDQQEFVKYANEQIIVELLGILDDLERSVEARESNHQDPQAFLKGIEMILSHLYEMLKKHKVRPLEAKGKLFDPLQHEALMQTESNEYKENTVIAELQKGYMLGDRVIRTAKVQVAKQLVHENKTEESKDSNKQKDT